MKLSKKFLKALSVSLALALAPAATFNISSAQAKDATPITAQANSTWYDVLNFDDESEKENALRGLIEAPKALVIYDDKGNVVWNVAQRDYMKSAEKIPATVNPSLWRNTLNNSYAGLFEVCEGIYQVRGYDMANITFIRTSSGWIVFDVLMCKETARQAVELMEKHFGKLNIKAVLYSHSHIDHYGGIEGVIDKNNVADKNLPLNEQINSGKVAIIAPEGFLQHAASENIYVGVAMGRRAQYQYGTPLAGNDTGSMSIGIGLGQAQGSISLVAPTYDVKTNETINIDGLEIQFQLTPNTEAPAEMNAYFPKYHALWLAENCTGTMHNLYTLRGAEVRDAAAWSHYILQAQQLFGKNLDVVFQSHNWPHWGREKIQRYMEDTAAVYKYIHDQTLHYVNQGYTSTEISNMIKLPDALNKIWYTRQYYGTLSHNSKAVYQKYIGWYDANPVNLNLLPPAESAKKLVEYLGDTDAVLAKARKDFEKGEYQWVAQITKELIFANPQNKAARELCADALEQLAYQAESGTWRNCYLVGALELRKGKNDAALGGNLQSMMNGLTMEMALDYLAIANDALDAQNDDVAINLNVTDTGEKFFIERKHGVFLIYKDENRTNADAALNCTKAQFFALIFGQNNLAQNQITGDGAAIPKIFAHCKTFSRNFNIVEP